MSTALITITPFGGSPTTKTPEEWGFRTPIQWDYRPLPGSDSLRLKSTRDVAEAFLEQGSRIQLKVDGVWAFDGVILTDPRTFSGTASEVEIEATGPAYFLQAQYQLGIDVYESSTANPDGSVTINYQTKFVPHFTLNRDKGGLLLGVRDQTVAITDYILAKAALAGYWTPFSASASDVADESALPQDVVNVTAVQAIQYQMELMDAVASFDHSQSPPAFSLRRRGGMGTVTLALGEPADADSPVVLSVGGLVRRRDREVTYVKLDFEIGRAHV